jgi:hypothetical protein
MAKDNGIKFPDEYLKWDLRNHEIWSETHISAVNELPGFLQIVHGMIIDSTTTNSNVIESGQQFIKGIHYGTNKKIRTIWNIKEFFYWFENYTRNPGQQKPFILSKEQKEDLFTWDLGFPML